MNNHIESAIEKQIMPRSRFWNKNLAEQRGIIKRIKSLKKKELYFFNDEFDCGKVNLMAKLEFDNGPEHSVRRKAFIFAHQFIRSFTRFSVEDYSQSMTTDATVKKFVLDEKALKIMILGERYTFLSGFNYSPNLRIISYNCPNSLWCFMYLFREYGEENAICVETFIKESTFSRASEGHGNWPNHIKDIDIENEKNETAFMLKEDPMEYLHSSKGPPKGDFPPELECAGLIIEEVRNAAVENKKNVKRQELWLKTMFRKPIKDIPCGKKAKK